MNKSELRQLITQNRLDEAISALLAKTEGTHLYQLAVLLAGQHADLKKQHIIAIESSSELENRRNHIARAALQLVEELPAEASPVPGFAQRYRIPLLALLLAAFAFALWAIYKSRSEGPLPSNTKNIAADSTAFSAALEKADIPALDSFLIRYPQSPYADKAVIQRTNLQNTLNFHVKSAEALYRGGKAQKAVEDLDKAMNLNPQDTEVIRLLNLFKQ